VVFWGASFVAAKLALGEMSPLHLVLARAVFATVALIIIQGSHGDWRWVATLSRREWARFVILTLVSVFIHQLAQMFGLQRTTAINSSLLITLAPVFMFVFSVLFFRERVTALKVLGFVVAIAGSVMVITRGDLGSLWDQAGSLAGDLLVIVSAIGWAVYSLLGKELAGTYSPTAVVGLVFASSLPILFTVAALGGGEPLSRLQVVSWRAWTAVAFLGWLCSALGYVLWYSALQKHHISRVGVLQYLQPLVTAVLGILLLGESLTGATIAGGLMIIGGVALVGQRDR
jgi:drug/metabolite transporter (DMT)-like permease